MDIQGRTGGKILFGWQVLGGAKTDFPLLRKLSSISYLTLLHCWREYISSSQKSNIYSLYPSILHFTMVEEKFGICFPKMALSDTIHLKFLSFARQKMLQFFVLKSRLITESIWYLICSFIFCKLTMVEENFEICRPKMALNNEIYLIFLYFATWKWFWNLSP